MIASVAIIDILHDRAVEPGRSSQASARPGVPALFIRIQAPSCEQAHHRPSDSPWFHSGTTPTPTAQASRTAADCHPFLDGESFEYLTPTGAEKKHRLMHTIERSDASCRRAVLAPALDLLDGVDLSEDLQLSWPRGSLRRCRGTILTTEHVPRALGNPKEASRVASDFGNVSKFVEASPKPVGDPAHAHAGEGFCRAVEQHDSTTALTCVTRPEDTGSQEFEWCETAEDRCEDTFVCINGFCSRPTPIVH